MAKKVYTVEKDICRATSTSTSYVQGTAEDISRYCGFKGSKIGVILNRWNADLENRYQCTFTRAYVKLVDSVPEGARITQA